MLEALGTNVQGVNPLLQTVRGRLQTRRSKLNDQINREILLRNGAEKLLKAMEDKKVKVQVALELSFFNSNIQLYKEELCDVNSNVSVYQFDSETVSIPMLPIGLKETKDVNFRVPFMDFIMEHYSENGEKYETQLQQLIDIRQAIRTPTRDANGIRNYLEYFNQLYLVEKRFFSPDRKLPIFFHWYDSLTGVPDTQRSIVYERACVMYNAGALYTQIACKQDHTTTHGLDAAIHNFQLAAGVFLYIRDKFSNAPSVDMQPSVLNSLLHIMLSQAQECMFERCMLGGVVPDLRGHVTVAQEASMVSQVYTGTYKQISDLALSDIIPVSWVSMVKVKYLYYRALSHYYLSMGLLQYATENDDTDVHLEEVVEAVHMDDCVYIKSDPKQHIANGKAHLRQSLILHGEALRDHDICKHMRKIDSFKEILQLAHDRTLEKFESIVAEDDFSDMMKPDAIVPLSHDLCEPITPDLSEYSVNDLFALLGPLSIFNALNQWSSPRLVIMNHTHQGYGFSVCGHSPVSVAEVDRGSAAHIGGLKENDIVIAVQEEDTKWSTHQEVVELILSAGTCLKLKIVSPMPPRSSQSDAESVIKRSSSVPCGSKNTSIRLQSPEGSVYSHKSTKGRKWLSITRLFSRQSSSKSEKSGSSNKEVMLR